MQETKGYGFDPWIWKSAWRRVWQSTPVFLSGEFHGQRSLAGYRPWGHKELDTTDWLTHCTYCLLLLIFLSSENSEARELRQVLSTNNHIQTLILLLVLICVMFINYYLCASFFSSEKWMIRVALTSRSSCEAETHLYTKRIEKGTWKSINK